MTTACTTSRTQEHEINEQQMRWAHATKTLFFFLDNSPGSGCDTGSADNRFRRAGSHAIDAHETRSHVTASRPPSQRKTPESKRETTRTEQNRTGTDRPDRVQTRDFHCEKVDRLWLIQWRLANNTIESYLAQLVVGLRLHPLSQQLRVGHFPDASGTPSCSLEQGIFPQG